MPIPTPKKGEDQKTFIGRCMGNDVMNKEFPDIKQRSAVCHSKWRRKEMQEIHEDLSKIKEKLQNERV